MAWATRGTNTNTGSATETATVTKPTNTDGDGIVITIRLGSGRTLTMPDGFAQIATGADTMQMWWKIASTEGTGDYSITWTGGGNTTYAIIAHAFYEDTGGATVFNVGAGANTGTNTDHDLASATVAYPNSYIVGCIGGTGGGSALTWTSSDLSEKADVQQGTAPSIWLGTTTQGSAGASGTKRVTSSISIAGRGGLIVFYRPQVHRNLPLVGVG